MYTKRDMVYADAYKFLRGKGVCGYQLKGRPEDFEEVDCPVEDVRVRCGVASWGGCNAMAIPGKPTYETIKARLVKMRYSNDDQLAVMLNGDPEEMARMQAWRDWAGDVAKAVCRKMGKPC